MGEEILTFGDIEIEKQKLYCYECIRSEVFCKKGVLGLDLQLYQKRDSGTCVFL